MQITIVGGCGLEYGAAFARRTGRQQSGQLSPRSKRMERSALVQTTSGNALKAVPSSMSDWLTLSVCRVDSASTAKKAVFSP